MSKYKISCIESDNKDPINQRQLFLIQPLEVGHGITLGNALRRSLLSDVTGYAINALRINGFQHEFNVVPYLKEDLMEIILNLKQVVFKPSTFLPKELEAIEASGNKLKAVLNVKGPMIVTASMFLLPYPYLTLLNPSQYICTIVDESNLYLEVDIEKGKAYKLIEDIPKEKHLDRLKEGPGKTIFIDSSYNPVKNVNYKVKLINDAQGNIKEALLFDVTTNGSMSPKRALLEGSKILINIFAPILLTDSYMTLSEKLFALEPEKIIFEDENSEELIK